MDLHHRLFCFFLLSLWDGTPGFIGAQIIHHTVTEGGSAEVKCPSSSASSRKFFCKESCRQRDILIETEAVSAQSGRFSIEWRRRRGSSSGNVFVNMSQLTKSDSGWYRCGVGPSLSSAKYEDTEIIVVDALLDGVRRETLTPKNTGNITVACYFFFSLPFTVTEAFLCRTECLTLSIGKTDATGYRGRYTIRYVEFNSGGSAYVSISQLSQYDSGRYTCGLKRFGLSNLERRFEISVTDETSTSLPLSTMLSKDPASPELSDQSVTSTTDILLYVGGTLAALVVLFLLALLIFCRRKFSKPKRPPIETEYTSISEAKYTKPSGIEIRSKDSSIPGSSSPCAAEDDSSKVTYSEIDFSDRTVHLLNSAPRGQADTVIYSTPR